MYFDRAFIDYLDSLDPLTEGEMEIQYPDPTKPELMEDPVAIMLQVDSSHKSSEIYPNTSQPYAFGFVITGQNLDKATEFLEYVLN